MSHVFFAADTSVGMVIFRKLTSSCHCHHSICVILIRLATSPLCDFIQDAILAEQRLGRIDTVIDLSYYGIILQNPFLISQHCRSAIGEISDSGFDGCIIVQSYRHVREHVLPALETYSLVIVVWPSTDWTVCRLVIACVPASAHIF